MDPLTTGVGAEVDRAFALVGGACLALFLGITLAMVWIVGRYHRSRNRTVRQVDGYLPIEIAWVVIPTIIVMWMFWVGYRGFRIIRSVPEGAMIVKVTGVRWNWQFHYPAEDIRPRIMCVPVGTPVKVELTAPADDVIHSFYLPDMRVKEDAVPGKSTYLWFRADRAGTYDIFCAEYCGMDHSKMLAEMRAVSRADYDSWVREERLRRMRPVDPAAFTDPHRPEFGPTDLNIDSEALFLTYCASCHGKAGDGSGLPGRARDFRRIDGWKASPATTDIFRTLQSGIPGTEMRGFPTLTSWEKVALAHRVRLFLGDRAPAADSAAILKVMDEFHLGIQPELKPTISVERAMELLSEER